MTVDPLIAKLEQFRKLTPEDCEALEDAVVRVTDYAAREDIIQQGEKPDFVHLLLEGWAGRYKILAEGERHIMAYLIPGDLCDIHVTLLNQMDHSIGALSPCKVALISLEKMMRILDTREDLSRALWWSALVDEATLREWLVTLGARPADKRIAHLICEMLLRTRAVGLSTDDSFELPLTQQELSDTMGMTVVHMNRMLQELRGRNLIESKGKRMIIKDLAALMEFSGFDPLYLHQVAKH
jgi:CRP-like cAMP-binding protein